MKGKYVAMDLTPLTEEKIKWFEEEEASMQEVVVSLQERKKKYQEELEKYFGVKEGKPVNIKTIIDQVKGLYSK